MTRDPNQTLGDGPIEPEFMAIMRMLAEGLDDALNGDLTGKDRENGFVLLVFPFSEGGGRANYISNAERDDVLRLLKEQVARFEGDYPDTDKVADANIRFKDELLDLRAENERLREQLRARAE